MGRDVASVRQNLDLIVDGGRAGARPARERQLAVGLHARWRPTRCGARASGSRADGALVYVGGPSLTITVAREASWSTPAAVRAMELDINTDWVQFSTYQGAAGQPVDGADGTSLLASMAGDPSRYFESWWIRDFYAMSVRPAPDDHLLAATAGRRARRGVRAEPR